VPVGAITVHARCDSRARVPSLERGIQARRAASINSQSAIGSTVQRHGRDGRELHSRLVMGGAR